MDTRRVEFEGIVLGNAREPIQPVVNAFREKGVVITRGTASSLKHLYRTGEPHNGNIIRERLLSAQRLGSNDASLKDAYYLQLVRTGISLRHPHKEVPHKWLKSHFTNSLAEAMGVPSNSVRKSIRAMRADLTYMELDKLLGQDLVKFFIQTAVDFIEVYIDPNFSAASPSVLRVKEEWDFSSMSSFYSCFYNNKSAHRGATIGLWTPYEVEVMEAFYQNQTAKKDPLTTLDMLILQSYSFTTYSNDLAATIRAKSLIDINSEVVSNHRNVLLYGKP